MKNGDGRIEEIKENYRKGLALENRLAGAAMEKAVPYGVQVVVECLHKHLYDQRLAVSWIKEQCNGVNGKNFASKFKYYSDQTPRSYWVKHRIETAKLLLKDEALAAVPVSTIAFNVGYNSPQTFSTTFKKYTGCSPTAFRDGPSED